MPPTNPSAIQQAMAGPHGGSAGTIAGKKVFLGNNLGCGFCAELTPFTYDYTGSGFVVSRATLPTLMTDTGPVGPAASRRWTATAIADVDGDGISDLILGDFGGPREPNDTSPGNYIVLGTATGWNGTPIRLPDPQNLTPGAYWVFFHNGPDRMAKGERVTVITVITVIAITPHP